MTLTSYDADPNLPQDPDAVLSIGPCRDKLGHVFVGIMLPGMTRPAPFDPDEIALIVRDLNDTADRVRIIRESE